ncbi:Flp family type IVb pilin [Vogesella sp. LYT5W]|uniref:Flp family type IVb pilin n=1 Tax=Vogesella margarita TaxID=2984199 RepID=A0ABT5IRE3_9NEIS|nr:Flp family type IVb pilin [Vogesella margarita]MDC7715133.1 Flp family type IVb pilin [Vogesella margarita]
MKRLIGCLRMFFSEECGVTAIEYALLGGLIAVVIVSAVTGVGASVLTLFLNVADQVGAAVAT